MIRSARCYCQWFVANWRWQFYRRMYNIKEFLGGLGIPIERKYHWGDIIKLGSLANPHLYRPWEPDQFIELNEEVKKLRKENKDLIDNMNDMRGILWKESDTEY